MIGGLNVDSSDIKSKFKSMDNVELGVDNKMGIWNKIANRKRYFLNISAIRWRPF